MPAASIAQTRPPAARPRRRTSVCTGCGDPREVSYETLHRIATGELSGLCPGCRGLAPVVSPSEADRKWWLQRFGVPAAALRGTTAADYITAHGMPAELDALAASIPHA